MDSGEGKDDPSTPIELLSGAIEASNTFLDAKDDTKERLNRVAQLIEGYEDPYGMELLSSVHWVMAHEPTARSNADGRDRRSSRLEPAKAKIVKT